MQDYRKHRVIFSWQKHIVSNIYIEDSWSDAEKEKQKTKIEGLKSINKFPARYRGDAGVRTFVENLENNIHKPGVYDTVAEKLSLDALKASIARDNFHHQGSLPNNFMQTLPAAEQAFRAINTFKDEYLPKHGEL